MKKKPFRTLWENGIALWRGTPALLAIYDAVAVNLAYFLALWLRFDARFSLISKEYLNTWIHFIPVYTGFCFLVFCVLKLYWSLWQFASYRELIRVLLATFLTAVFHIVGITHLYRMPRSYYLLGPILQFLMTLGIRFSYRLFLLILQTLWTGDRRERVMIIGAGSAGQRLLRDVIHSERIHSHVCCIIDDDPRKWRRFIDGVEIVGGRDEILASVKKYQIERIYLAIPTASAQEQRDILNICKETNCALKSLPATYQILRGEPIVNAMRDVSIEDLLGRAPIRTDMEGVFRFITGKRVLVTGGGGSIGSELCRQIAAHEPELLIIFDIYENNAYDIQWELRDQYPNLNLHVLIGSVRDSRRLQQIFDTYRPELVYHAAAHKHVPLMEDAPCESIKNNVLGTYKTAYMAMAYGCKRFVLVSTDKAVNPVNIMGASKRLCEMVIQSFDAKVRAGTAWEVDPLYTHPEDDSIEALRENLRQTRTEFVAVRFGNVLGSNGSVIPIFRRQIAKGGPVTVTHPDVIRYFMSIPEAVSLVLTAGTYAEGGEIFVLDMGSPVKIDQLARNMIRLSGLKPDVDIAISYTGLRPGEKLYEEKLMSEEGLRKTANNLIYIGSPIPFDTDQFLGQIKPLMEAAYRNQDNIRALVEALVPTYHPKKEAGSDTGKNTRTAKSLPDHFPGKLYLP